MRNQRAVGVDHLPIIIKTALATMVEQMKAKSLQDIANLQDIS